MYHAREKTIERGNNDYKVRLFVYSVFDTVACRKIQTRSGALATPKSSHGTMDDTSSQLETATFPYRYGFSTIEKTETMANLQSIIYNYSPQLRTSGFYHSYEHVNQIIACIDTNVHY